MPSLRPGSRDAGSAATAVLVLETDAAGREALVALLRDAGFLVIVATTVDEARRLVASATAPIGAIIVGSGLDGEPLTALRNGLACDGRAIEIVTLPAVLVDVEPLLARLARLMPPPAARSEEPSLVEEVAAMVQAMLRLEERLLGEPELPEGSRPAVATIAATAGRLAQVARARGTIPAPATSVAGARPEARPRVLIVDDDEITRQSLAELIEGDFEVATAKGALEGIAHAQHAPVDAIVTDVHMPGIDGLGFLRLLRDDPRTADVPCLFLSADDATREKRDAFGQGAVDYLTKPCDPVELTARLLRRIGEARRLGREHALQGTDELTGLPNRRAFQHELPASIATARATSRPLSVAFVDADGLKRINDTWGHASGDEAIRAIARTLHRGKRGGDFAARLGGDEFALVMPGTGADGAERLLSRLAEDLQHTPLRLGGEAVPLRMSVGIASLHDADDASSLLERADRALYAQKRARPAPAASSSPGPRLHLRLL